MRPHRKIIGFTLVLILFATPVMASFVSMITAFCASYLGGKVVDHFWDKLTGKLDVTALDIRLSEIEGVFREIDSKMDSKLAVHLESLRKQLSSETTKQEYNKMLQETIVSINSKMEALEGRVANAESSIRDLDSRLKRLETNTATAIPFKDAVPVVDLKSTARKPIDNLFRAWVNLDFQLYISQWSMDAVQYAKGRISDFSSIKTKRKNDFRAYRRVTATYRIEGIEFTKDCRSAIAKVKYSMSFQKQSGQTIFENDIRERYHLSYDFRLQRWIIKENYDYL